MVLLVVNDPEKLNDVLKAWETIGVPGVTVLYSTGIGRFRQSPSLWEELPLFPSIDDFFQREELHNRTIFSIVPDEDTADQLVTATKKIIGDFTQPDTGLLVIMPTIKVFGLEKNSWGPLE
jgi:nitrogen regulatory protein PII